MDKADLSFIVASICYLLLTLIYRSGCITLEVLDISGIVLWGVYMITALIKARFTLVYICRAKAIAAASGAVILFLLSILIPIINP